MRRKEIKSLAYFRDLGGLKTTDNRIIKKGVFFRTSEIKDLSQKDLEELINDYGIKTCIDLRTDEEVERSPDELVSKVNYHHIPLVSNEDNPAVTKETRLPILKMRMKEEGGMKGHIQRLYRLLVNNPQSISGFKEIFDLFINEDGPFIYHCTQGKDRTGLLSAFILIALGVDKEIIIEDYLKFNRFHRWKRFWIFVAMSICFFPFRAARELNYALVARRVFIESAFEEMEKQAGDLLSFLKSVIGLSDDNITILREKYLQSA